MGHRQLDVSAVLDLAPRRGRPRPRPLSLKLAAERVTLREVITRAVEVELRRAESTRGALLVAVLGAQGAEILATGQRHDQTAEVERALAAFRSGSYRVLLDGLPILALDETLSLGLRSRLLFLRVLPLVSG